MIGFMPAVGDLVRCTDGSWMTRPPQSCQRGHPLGPGAMLVGHGRGPMIGRFDLLIAYPAFMTGLTACR
jgi:hypothetical protein